MSKTLSPCPFCGGNPYFYQITVRYKDTKVWRVMCGSRVDCCAILNDYDTQEQAADAWNHRCSITGTVAQSDTQSDTQKELEYSENSNYDKLSPDAVNQIVSLMRDFAKSPDCSNCRDIKQAARAIFNLASKNFLKE